MRNYQLPLIILLLNSFVFCSLFGQSQNSYCEPAPEEAGFLTEDETLCAKHPRLQCTINISNTNTAALGISGYSNQTICISGVLTINTNFSFVGCIIKFTPGSQIIVDGSNNLTIYFSSLFACEEMWKGIQVKENAEIDVYQTEIEDAQYALDLIKPAVVIIKNNTLNRNYIGIRCLQSSTVPLTPFIIKGNRYYCNSALNSPYSGQSPSPGIRTFCGVFASSHPALTVDGYYDSFYLSFVENIFKELNNGVVAVTSNISISHSSFEYMINDGIHAGYFDTGIGIYGDYYSRITHMGRGTSDPSILTFNNCENTGVQTKASFLNTSQSIHNNIGVHGVKCTNQYLFGASIVSNKFIGTNTINTTLRNIYLEKGLSPSHISSNTISKWADISGIEVRNPSTYSSMINIEHNSIITEDTRGIMMESGWGDGFFISLNNLDAVSFSKAGILSRNNYGNNYSIKTNDCYNGHAKGIESSSSYNTLFCNNDLYDNSVGMKISDSHAGSIVSRNNFYGSNTEGLTLTGTAMLGDQMHKANTWNGTFSGNAAVYYFPPIFSDSEFFVNSTFPSQNCYGSTYFPTSGGSASVNPGIGFFEQNYADTCQFCEDFVPDLTDSSSWFNVIVLSGGMESYGYSSGASWEADYYVYSSIIDNPELYLDPIYSDAVDRIFENSLIPHWYEMNSLFRSVADGPDNFSETFLENESFIQNILAQLKDLEIEYTESGELSGSWDSLSTALEYYLAESQNLSVLYDLWGEEKLEILQSMLLNLNPQTDMDMAMLDLMSIRLSLIQNPNNFLENLGAITNLSEKCYNQYGPATKMATTLLPSCLQNQYFENDFSCVEGKPVISGNSRLHNRFSDVALFPNPVNLFLQINFNINFNNNVLLNITNLLGHQVLESEIKNGDKIDVSKLPSGTYFAQLIASDGKLYETVKFIKL